MHFTSGYTPGLTASLPVILRKRLNFEDMGSTRLPPYPQQDLHFLVARILTRSLPNEEILPFPKSHSRVDWIEVFTRSKLSGIDAAKLTSGIWQLFPHYQTSSFGQVGEA